MSLRDGGAGATSGNYSAAPSPREVLEARLKRLMLLRLVMVTTLLLVAAYVEAASEYLLPVNPLYFVIGATYALTVLHALALRYTRRLEILAVAQVVGDLIAITGLVWLTGGTEGASASGLSIHRAGFMLLYPISVLSGAVLVGRPGAVSLAGVATASYAGLLRAVWSGWLPPRGLADIPLLAPSALVYSVFVTGVVCLTVALVASYLNTSLRSVGAQLEEAEEQVADLQELNEVIVNSIHSGLVTTSADGRVQTINGFGESILGNEASAIRGRPIDEVFGSALLAPEVLRRRGIDASLARIELGYERPDASRLQLGISIWPLSPTGSVGEGHLLVFQDLTEIKRLEDDVRMKEKLAAVGEMASQLAHEIRNPLGAISGSAQMLLGGSNMTTDQSRLLDIITRESRRLSDTLNRFLMQASPRSLRAEPVDLGPVIERAVVLLRNSPEVGPLRVVEYEASPGPFVCRADADQMTQVFWNIARNGLEAMSAAGGVLSVRLSAARGDVVLSVRDQGPGVEGAEAGRLFEPFYSGRSMGSGLGLAIVYRIVREHRGDISVSSTPGSGTEVQVRLPLMGEPGTA